MPLPCSGASVSPTSMTGTSGLQSSTLAREKKIAENSERPQLMPSKPFMQLLLVLLSYKEKDLRNSKRLRSDPASTLSKDYVRPYCTAERACSETKICCGLRRGAQFRVFLLAFAGVEEQADARR